MPACIGHTSCVHRLAQSELVSLVAGLGQAREGAAALLVEVKADSPQALQERIGAAQAAMRGGAGVAFGGRQGDDSSSSPGVDAYPFRVDPKVILMDYLWHWRVVAPLAWHASNRADTAAASSWHNRWRVCFLACLDLQQETKIFWDFRKGLIPIIGGSRSVGTAMLIEVLRRRHTSMHACCCLSRCMSCCARMVLRGHQRCIPGQMHLPVRRACCRCCCAGRCLPGGAPG